MRRILVLVTTVFAAINPTGFSPLAAFQVATAQAKSVGEQIKTIPFKMTLATTALNPLQIEEQKPDFATEVSIPIREAAKKAALKAKQKAEKARLAAMQYAPKATVVIVNTGDAWAQLRFCEAGGDYHKNTGNGFYGAYQFDYSTWGGYGGYATANLAPPKVQDAKARMTQAARGWYPWPACARRLGLIK